MDNLLRKSKEIRTILGGTQDKMRKEARDLVSITANTLKNVRNQYSRASGKRVPDLNFGVLHGIVKASDTNEKNNSKKARNRVGYGPSNIFGVCRNLIIP